MFQENLFTQATEPKKGYKEIYRSLGQLRELFHKSGRFDDSNMKLDEVVKLLSTYIAYRRGFLNSFPDPQESKTEFIRKLQDAFQNAAKLDLYLNKQQESVFGLVPSLSLREGDEVFAKDLVQLVITSVDTALQNKEADHPFDLLNEAFGHFIRDNFRGNIEDAQYMTPPEVVDFMVEVVLNDLQKKVNKEERPKTLTILDPSCGVGSFLATFYHKAKNNNFLEGIKLNLIGQDKVDRMVRLSTVNLSFFDVPDHSVSIGNSLSKGSPLDALNGKVDIILTNPPFGAKFSHDEIKDYGVDNFPFFATLNKGVATIDSELLFVDRNLSLLREHGLLILVVPDSVISARGIHSLLRQYLRKTTTIRAIVELPSVAFAQAGTRTKTSILYLQKGRSELNSNTIFIAQSKRLGFEVSSRKGVQIKIEKGENDLDLVYKEYKKISSTAHDFPQILSDSPSVVTVDYQKLIEGSWTPNHYNASRVRATRSFTENDEIELISLESLVEFCSKGRKTQLWQPDTVFISVLHVANEGNLDVASIQSYAPKTPGYPVYPDEILLSKINPRIPRVLVVPKMADKILCSSEFEIMKAQNGIDPYLLSFLLLTKVVQSQIQGLTSGTSASHSRIKTLELAKVKLPIPKKGSNSDKRLQELIKTYRESIESMFEQTVRLTNVRSNEEFWDEFTNYPISSKKYIT